MNIDTRGLERRNNANFGCGGDGNEKEKRVGLTKMPAAENSNQEQIQ